MTLVEIIAAYQDGVYSAKEAVHHIEQSSAGAAEKAHTLKFLDLEHYVIAAAIKSAGARLPWEGW